MLERYYRYRRVIARFRRDAVPAARAGSAPTARYSIVSYQSNPVRRTQPGIFEPRRMRSCMISFS